MRGGSSVGYDPLEMTVGPTATNLQRIHLNSRHGDRPWSAREAKGARKEILGDRRHVRCTVREMRFVRFTPQTGLQLAVTTLPVTPLLQTMISREDLLGRLRKAVF
jgi:hypothetical protein